MIDVKEAPPLGLEKSTIMCIMTCLECYSIVCSLLIQVFKPTECHDCSFAVMKICDECFAPI